MRFSLHLVLSSFFLCEGRLLSNKFIKKTQMEIDLNSEAGNDIHYQIVSQSNKSSMLPIVINTWAFTEGTKQAWETLQNGGSILDAVEKGCSRCEELQYDHTVGYGGSPDENGETTLDAMIMDGSNHAAGAVGCLRRVKSAISVARKVLEHSEHTLLVGELATQFAVSMGFTEESLTTPFSEELHNNWKENNCQPNFWKNVYPNPKTSCGPYTSIPNTITQEKKRIIDRYNHDTVGMVIVANGQIVSGTSSNGARNKIPGRVGDAPIVGAGSYVDNEVGGAAATGDGDIMVRFLPSFLAVEKMRDGMSPKKAAEYAIFRIAQRYQTFSGALVAVNIKGEYGAACHGIQGGFPFSVRNPLSEDVVVEIVECI